MSTSTRDYTIVVEQSGLAIIEVYGEFYVVSNDGMGQVRSITPQDWPQTKEQRFARLSTTGILSVASPLSLAKAKQEYKKLLDVRLATSWRKF